MSELFADIELARVKQEEYKRGWYDGRADLQASRTEADAPYERVLQLTKALEQCVRVAQMWHGDDAFDIYFNHSPEMKLVRDALGKMPDPTEQTSGDSRSKE